ncbi:MAG: (2Fe-2S)-binding protein [Firmicutes bacterium]|nr:(2Fe-2S)-binding protein [Bacillota bacterium]
MKEYLDRTIDIGPYVPEADDDLIICRCEEITKGEIRRAIHEGMFTMTEVKRYLRTGMGLCQGQTCGRLVKQIMEKELSKGISTDGENTARAPMRPIPMNVYGKEAE